MSRHGCDDSRMGEERANRVSFSETQLGGSKDYHGKIISPQKALAKLESSFYSGGVRRPDASHLRNTHRERGDHHDTQHL